MRKMQRWMAIGVATAVAAIGLEVGAPAIAGATQVSLVCNGITGDKASSLGDSKATLALLATISGGSGGLTFSADITTDAPAKVTPTSGQFTANFDLKLTLPDSLVGPATELLGLSSVEVRDATYVITASGAATATMSKKVPSQVVDLTKSPVVVKQRVSGSIKPTGGGTITYRPGATTLSIVINKKVAGITINSLTVKCGSSKDISTTAVQIPGAPVVTQPMYQVAWTASVVGRPLIGKDIKPDNGNPLIPNSLKLTRQAPNGGYSAVGGGAAFYLAPRETGLYNVEYKVCAASKVIPRVPGVNSVQTFEWPESYVGKGLNAHPIAMTLQFKGEKSKPIPLSYRKLGGSPSPVHGQLLGFEDQFLSDFRAPTAAQMQKALEGISTIGTGNVKVTGGTNATPYAITFVGRLASLEQPKIDVVDWLTWLPSETLTAALAAFNPAPPAPGTPTTVPAPVETVSSLDGKLASGQITVQQWLDGRLGLLKGDIIGGLTTPASIATITALFPKQPEFALSTVGKPAVPASETGPLCTSFTIGYFVIPNPNQ